MPAVELSHKENKSIAYFTFYENMKLEKKRPRFNIEDKLRISKHKRRVSAKVTRSFKLKRFYILLTIYIHYISIANPVTSKLIDFVNKKEGFYNIYGN